MSITGASSEAQSGGVVISSGVAYAGASGEMFHLNCGRDKRWLHQRCIGSSTVGSGGELSLQAGTTRDEGGSGGSTCFAAGDGSIGGAIDLLLVLVTPAAVTSK